jgi:sorting nexin-25
MSPSAYIPLDARIYGPLGVLFLALIFPQLSFVQTILLLPIFICAIFGSGIAAVTYFAVREELKNTAPDTLAYQRHALPKLAFTTSSAWSAVLTRRSWEESPSPIGSTPIRSMSSPGLIERLNTLFDLIKIHFILPWHDRISPSPAFPNAVELLIRQSMSKVIERGEGVDWPDLMVARIVPRLTDHLEHFRSIEHFSSTSAAPAIHTSLPLPLPRKAHPALADAAHARAAGLSPNIEAHLRSLVKRLLLHVLPEPEQTEVVSTVVTEVVLGSVLLPVFEMLCDSDFWNRQIDDKGGKYLREQ